MGRALDGARLEFLEAHTAITSVERKAGGGWVVYQGFIAHAGATLRSAIDTAAESFREIAIPIMPEGRIRLRRKTARSA